MAKRIAEKELTDRNWDQEDEAEEVNYALVSPYTPLQVVESLFTCAVYLVHKTYTKTGEQCSN